jgi:hypothetical protein
MSQPSPLQPSLAIPIQALGDHTDETNVKSSGLAVVAAAGSLLLTGTEYVALESVTGAFEGLLTGTSSGLPGIVGVAGVVGFISIGTIISVSLVIVANFYLVLRRNNYRYRNAIVSVYEFYETLMRLGNMLSYLEEVSKTLEPRLKLDSDEIYQDIKNIFQVLDLITTSTAFSSVNIDLATGAPFNVSQQSQQPQSNKLLDKFLTLSRRASGMVKGVTFNETKWLNKMNAAVARFNTHVIMLMSEWNIIANLRSKNTPEERVERTQLPAFTCIIRHIVLAPIIRLRNIMYACALSTQSDLCQMHAKQEMVDNTISSKIKRLWTKWIAAGGNADFNKLLTLLSTELRTITTNPDYSAYIEAHAIKNIDELTDAVGTALKSPDDITQDQYSEIYEKVENIYQYANACNTNGVVFKMRTITTNRYMRAAQGTAIERRVVGPDETKKIDASIRKYTIFHEKVTTVLISSGAAIIDPSNPLIIGAILLKIPYNHFYIPPNIPPNKIEDSKYSAYLTQILVELNIIHSRASRNDAIIKAEPNIGADVLTASNDALTAALQTKTEFETLKTELDREAAAAELIVQGISRTLSLSLRASPQSATAATAAATKATAKAAVATIKLQQIDPLITKINLDQNTMRTLIGNLDTVSLPALRNVPNVDDTLIYIEDIESLNKQITSILSLEIETRNKFYSLDFITYLQQIQLFFKFISHMIEQIQQPLDFRNDFIIGIFVAKCLLFAFIINNDVIRFKTKDLLDTIKTDLKMDSCKTHYEALYEHENIQGRFNQGNRIKIINFSKGFLCSIDEVRMIEKIKLLMDAEAQQQQRVECSLVTSNGYASFNTALSVSQYGGSKKHKLFYSVKRKNKCVKSVKKSRTKRNGVIASCS